MKLGFKHHCVFITFKLNDLFNLVDLTLNLSIIESNPLYIHKTENNRQTELFKHIKCVASMFVDKQAVFPHFTKIRT